MIVLLDPEVHNKVISQYCCKYKFLQNSCATDHHRIVAFLPGAKYLFIFHCWDFAFSNSYFSLEEKQKQAIFLFIATVLKYHIYRNVFKSKNIRGLLYSCSTSQNGILLYALLKHDETALSYILDVTNLTFIYIKNVYPVFICKQNIQNSN